MKAELENKLLRRFPLMYRTYYAPMTETCMCWGFSHDDGWFDIIWQLSLAIEDELNYSWFRTKWYLFLDRFARRWNKLIYKLSPVRQRQYKTEGTGTKEDPIRQVLVSTSPPPLDEKIIQFLFGEKVKIGKQKWETDRIFLKRLSMQSTFTGFSVTQVKEKFGTLRFYVSAGNDRIYHLINLAERLSAVTCERCGKYGKERSGGWIKTLCDKCAEIKA